MVRDCPIANVLSNELKSSDLIAHCKMCRDAGASTTYHDVAQATGSQKLTLSRVPGK
jgi:hypothetical protein